MTAKTAKRGNAWVSAAGILALTLVIWYAVKG